MNNRLFALSVCASLATCIAYAGATGPVYPAPGGNTFSSSGNQGSAGGKTYNFGGFDPTAYGSLYWGAENPTTDGDGIQNVSNSGNATPGYMNFTGTNGSSFEWDSTSNWNFSSAFYGNLSLPTRMLLTFAGAETPTTKAAATIASANLLEPVAQVNGDFSGNFVFEALYGGVWRPVLDFYNSANCISNCGVSESAAFGFWYTQAEATTPEPSGYAFLLAGLIGLAAIARRYLLA